MKLILLLFSLFFATETATPQGVIIPTDTTQTDFLKAYKMVLNQSSSDYWLTSGTADTNLFPLFGEYSVYWAKNGANRGSFVYPDQVPANYAGITALNYQNYDWKSANHYSLQFKNYTYRIGIFNSLITKNNKSVTWQSVYFRNMFESFFFNNMYYNIDERFLDTNSIYTATQLVIIPSFTIEGRDQKIYIDSVFRRCPNIKQKFDAFLANGGTIYAEGNAVYFIEKLGYLAPGAVDFNNMRDGDPKTGLIKIAYSNLDNPIAYTNTVTKDSLYCSSIPKVDAGAADVVAEVPGFSPAVFVLKGDNAGKGRIICNTGLPTSGGINDLKTGSRQLQWTLNSMMFAFCNNLDLTHSVYNDLPSGITATKNSVAFDAKDTFMVRVQIRNLSDQPLTGVEVYETFRQENVKNVYRTYFTLVDVLDKDVNAKLNGNTLSITGLDIAPYTEKIITYRLTTPDEKDSIHESVNKYISFASSIFCASNFTKFQDSEGLRYFWKYNNYANIMFSARLVADADLNWKNFLFLNYQPFKVFMIMENKERTDALETKYVQYVPKDVPFYWTDGTIDIPILKTPGGKYVDVLRGSNDEKNPEFDMDHDGHPDVWLDTASIYPKNYTITEDSVYWLNPWEHLRSGDSLYYEDIDHDGKRAMDLNGDGIVDVEEPGDKIRVWKITWTINKVAGYQYFDPYCYYDIWVDPPELVNMSAGVGEAYMKMDEPVSGAFYPYSPTIQQANLSDTSWTHWMDRDANGNIIWKQFIYQKVKNYEGFTYIDTLKENYKLKATDKCVGTVPQPHREFIAVLSLGGEEIDMTHPTPNQSLYSKLEYKTIFNEPRVTPIRTTYTYYAPLPNPLQFEYLSNNFVITDSLNNDTLKYLPKYGTVNLTFDVDASTEYSYYWIRNAGHDVKYNDPSEKIEGDEKLGDGVFGYMIYDIPKGMGGYSITLPKKADGSYDFNQLVEIDGHPFQKWLENKNTKNDIEVWEDVYQYHIYIPQLLIPPAIDDDNHDGIDDWIDDRGDRFASSTGFLHDAFMLDDGEKWRNYPKVPFKDDIYGMVDSGWYCGPDNTYGDDFFENLGKTHVKIKAIYQGKGKEGPVDISKGGWLVVEEIFGGSPWVIFSHVLSGYAQGVDMRMSSWTTPSVVRYGLDTTYIKHYIEDRDEPHLFDVNFDPYHVSYGYGETTITTLAGGKDPCSLIEPPIDMSTIIDASVMHTTVRLIPNADPDNPDLKDYPKKLSGTFLEVKLEVSNGTDDNWLNTRITPVLPDNLGSTELVMDYVAYPRPLVPAKVDPNTGAIIQGADDIGSFKAGWRFNQPEGEVLVKAGPTLPLLQPSRRAYFVKLFKIDETLSKGVYQIGFVLDGVRRNYKDPVGIAGKNEDGSNKIQGKTNNYEVPPAMFSITGRDYNTKDVAAYQKIKIGVASIDSMKIFASSNFAPTSNVKWSPADFNYTNFDTMSTSLSATFDPATQTERIDMGKINAQKADLTKFYMLEQGIVNSQLDNDQVKVSTSDALYYTPIDWKPGKLEVKDLYVKTSGPKLKDYKRIVSLNGKPVTEKDPLVWDDPGEKDVEVAIELFNNGSNLAENVELNMTPGTSFVALANKLPQNCALNGDAILAQMGSMIPGETKKVNLHFGKSNNACLSMFTESSVLPQVDIRYKGNTAPNSAVKAVYKYTDKKSLNCPTYDFVVNDIKADIKDLTYGSISQVSIDYQNGIMPAKNVALSLFAIINNQDTVFVAKKDLSTIDSLQAGTFTTDFVIPYDAHNLELMAKIDADNSVIEFCEDNNEKLVDVPIKGPSWIKILSVYPNPFKQLFSIDYVLARDMQNVSIVFYTLDGHEIDRMNNCPNTYGWHSLSWDRCADLPIGTYVYHITGTNKGGERELYVGVAEKY